MKNYTDIEKYKIACYTFKFYQEKLDYKSKKKFNSSVSGFHEHHIKPKSIYPELEYDRDNIIKVPGIIHWMLHEQLRRFAENKTDIRFNKIKYSNVKDYIIKNKKLNIEFNSELEDELFEIVLKYFPTEQIKTELANVINIDVANIKQYLAIRPVIRNLPFNYYYLWKFDDKCFLSEKISNYNNEHIDFKVIEFNNPNTSWAKQHPNEFEFLKEIPKISDYIKTDCHNINELEKYLISENVKNFYIDYNVSMISEINDVVKNRICRIHDVLDLDDVKI